MRLALVHDYLTQTGGAEKVLSAFYQEFPEAPIYTLVYNPKRFISLGDRDVHTSFIQRLPGGIKHYQWFLPLMPWATERLDLRGYDIVLSSASAFAKGVVTGDHTLHICYCHTPTRYLWSDAHSYVEELPYPNVIKKMIPAILVRLRMWDFIAAQRPDILIANSENVRRRIGKYYRRDSKVLHPPVNIDSFSPVNDIGRYYLTGGRLVSYKHFEIVIEAFNRLRMPLKIFGEGPAQTRLMSLAKPNVEFLGYCSREKLADAYARCVAFIQPQEEDFGITAIEAMASGRPVIALGAGGALEAVQPGKTGVFFEEQSWEALADTVVRFAPKDFEAAAIRSHAELFSETAFRQKIRKIIDESWIDHCASRSATGIANTNPAI
ncbi:hypothetical protein A3E96_04995 [Candidatus Uhrbacteria bacterium RIFCSPHIGHO2_12_FULL_46_13]|uniref:Glycosyl transferase family 1 domain-containing protein n=1 Tax=Candidatus Uhrbacteria bacterium RIFCSPLOWO2_01_FULL_47_25 TaxID=1802402 RepID=A0A1F7UZF4_9BACT|nr:MAG: Glycosyl transferase group 1 [Parcubacteria group bacterium GW2011_GWA2_46_9]OGL61350.1 MAG: hypothetical protein A2752_01530 [Candidatus Uhrbacteria bacterium RIFCSPHIGHO2_01_FULL_46_23]OGL70627.1 MAG: hypothetical protein A3D60_04150 [Candidatus Uhrbacteria bacterium RIFCSPHIGHO2_02_FULL_47_29]OGL74953.1 MAG: hypothetical protein A3E96_04995 [Candidatus Uhrbacteria bacterium RIFCSPHIGHO2_12_FULL_46_13]OGL83134.1 MAG: hypothetical protein A2936_01375 [Candidatus Uhrbacteria bacterium R